MSSYSSVTLITGPTGSGKTSLLATAAEYLWKEHKKILRIYTADGGGFGTKVQALIEAGLVQVWRLRTRCQGGGEGLIEETCMRASQGWWPKTFTDVLRGEVAAGVELLPPVTSTFTQYCPNKHPVKTATIRAAVAAPSTCPECKIVVTVANCTIGVEEKQTPGFEIVGGVAIEGLTSLGDWVMISLADRSGRNELGGEKSAIGANIRSGDMMFGSNNRAHYGFAQTQTEKWLLNSTAIPNLIVAPIWTGLETRIDESGGIALPFYGPAIPGQAKTGKVPQWVGNYLGAQGVITDKGRKEWRLYLTEYRDPADMIPHYYKTRAEPGTMPEYLADEPGGQPFTGFNLGVFFKLFEEATRKSLEKTKTMFPDAPGPVTQAAAETAPMPRQMPAVTPPPSTSQAKVAGTATALPKAPSRPPVASAPAKR